MNKYRTYLYNLDVLIFRKIFQYFYEHRIKTYTASLIILAVFIIRKLPYVNIFLSLNVLWSVIAIIIFCVYNVSRRNTVITCISLFIISPFFIIFHKPEYAELIGNIIFFLLWFTLIKSLKNM